MVCHFTRLDFGQRRYVHSAETRMPRKHHMHKAVLPERSLRLQMASMHEKRMAACTTSTPPSAFHACFPSVVPNYVLAVRPCACDACEASLFQLSARICVGRSPAE